MRKFGQLTTEQIRGVIGMLPELDAQRLEMLELMSGGSDKANQLLASMLPWASLYEKTPGHG